MPVSETRNRNLFNPDSAEPYRLSRSKLENFLECPRCFYLDRRLGIERPDFSSPTLNLAVDFLLKREFDSYRIQEKPHPIMSSFGMNAIPLKHSSLEEWRDMNRGISFHDPVSNFILFGAVDDIWLEEVERLLLVDYKAMSAPYGFSKEHHLRPAYKRQLEVYRWLLRQNGFSVSETAYLLFANADRDKSGLNDHLAFTSTLVPIQTDDSWLPDALNEAKLCLCKRMLPQVNPDCPWCRYRLSAEPYELSAGVFENENG